MIGPARPLAEVTERAISVLSREMGVADTIRFLNQFVTGSGDYTQERKGFLKDVTMDEIVAEIRDRSASPSSS